uniref:HesB-like domain containing protein n=2 Tax=Babesia bovis TaxID=5865 RepID=A7AP06_BABBO|eukprot:XP_001611858.1 HesB-like domain containing protein [Babesia bovis T2Bo]
MFRSIGNSVAARCRYPRCIAFTTHSDTSLIRTQSIANILPRPVNGRGNHFVNTLSHKYPSRAVISQFPDTRCYSSTVDFEVRRHKLKPRRKQLVTLSEKAVARLKEICNDPSRIVKLFFVVKGCNGYSYEMEIVDRNSLDDMDELISDDSGTSVLAIENKAAFHMLGCHIDYEISPLEEGFVFSNPNVTSKCGCGQSFRF